ncbi:MAG: hypothetical protein AAFQ66_16040 [Pseudomonadota bacterium]
MARSKPIIDISLLGEVARQVSVARFQAGGPILSQEGETAATWAPNAPEDTYDLWRCACEIAGANLMFVRGADRFSVACANGGIILESRKPFNVGLLRRALKVLPLVQSDPAPAPVINHFSQTQSVVWKIADRLSMTEIPRSYRFAVGDMECTIHANKTGFSITEIDGGLDAFLQAIEAATASNQDVRYSLTSGSNKEETAYGANDLFGQSSIWKVAEDGWPTGIPNNVPGAVRKTVTAMVQCLTTRQADQLDLFDESGRRILLLQRTETEFKVTMQ